MKREKGGGLTIYKAQAIADEVLPDLALTATEEVPPQCDHSTQTSTLFESVWRDFYMTQGKYIVDALYASLPGGTIDAVLVELLDRKRSIYRVSP